MRRGLDAAGLAYLIELAPALGDADGCPALHTLSAELFGHTPAIGAGTVFSMGSLGAPAWRARSRLRRTRCGGAALSNRNIADWLVLSERTVESHVRNILAKTGLARTEFTRWYSQRR